MKFEWDEIKNYDNIIKHGVSFEEATSIFLNIIVEEPDLEHSENEERYIAVGIKCVFERITCCILY